MSLFRLTAAKVKVLQVMLENPNAEHWGYQLMERSGVKSGSLYPILRQLEALGMVTSHLERLDAEAAGRPPRRYYRLTGEGRTVAQAAIEEFVGGFPFPLPRSHRGVELEDGLPA